MYVLTVQIQKTLLHSEVMKFPTLFPLYFPIICPTLSSGRLLSSMSTLLPLSFLAYIAFYGPCLKLRKSMLE